MSTLDKFKNHKTAYLLTRNGLIPEYENISEVDIISVGRKYVTITNNVKFAESGYERNCLIEQVNCGWSSYLFAVKRDALDYVEKRQIVAWLGKSENLLNDMSLEKVEHYHHIVPRSMNGSNTIGNIAGLCMECHDKVHKHVSYQKKLNDVKKGLDKKYGALSALNQAVPFICKRLETEFGKEHVSYCTGRDTAKMRSSFGFQKTKDNQMHETDAWCIGILSLNRVPDVIPDFGQTYRIRQFRRQDSSACACVIIIASITFEPSKILIHMLPDSEAFNSYSLLKRIVSMTSTIFECSSKRISHMLIFRTRNNLIVQIMRITNVNFIVLTREPDTSVLKQVLINNKDMKRKSAEMRQM